MKLHIRMYVCMSQSHSVHSRPHKPEFVHSKMILHLYHCIHFSLCTYVRIYHLHMNVSMYAYIHTYIHMSIAATDNMINLQQHHPI